ncbi:MAG: hypothetical protein WA004_01480 [Saprospiraceae bacterium]
MDKRFFLGAALMVAAFFGCKTETLEDYYFPLDELREGLVYEYRSAGDTLDPPFYWFYKTIEQEGVTYLTGMYYDANFTPFQFVREERVDNGMLMTDYYLYETDSTGKQIQVPVNIEAGNAFSFGKPNPKTVLFSKISFTSPSAPGMINTLVKNRQYVSDTTYVFGGQTYDALVFYVRELIDIEDQGHTEHEYDGTEIYAKGLGLVYFRKNVSEAFVTEYRLVDRYGMEGLEEKVRR